MSKSRPPKQRPVKAPETRLIDRVLRSGIKPLEPRVLVGRKMARGFGKDIRELFAGIDPDMPDAELVTALNEEVASEWLPTFDPFIIRQIDLRRQMKDMPNWSDERFFAFGTAGIAPYVPLIPLVTAEEVVSAEHFVLDDVEQFVVQTKSDATISETIDAIAPPYDRFFVEMLHSDVPGSEDMLNIHSIGVLVEAIDAELGVQLFGNDPAIVDARWLLRSRVLVEPHPGQIMDANVDCLMAVDRNGYPIPMSNGRPIRLRGSLEGKNLALVYRPMIDLIAIGALQTTFFGVSLMNCSNVQRRDVNPNLQLKNVPANKRPNRPFENYIVLDVGAITKFLDQTGNAHTEGLAHAMHFCRAHFKTFTAERRLFGKYTGRFFWEAHVRGNPEVGINTHGHNVQAPDISTPDNGPATGLGL